MYRSNQLRRFCLLEGLFASVDERVLLEPEKDGLLEALALLLGSLEELASI